MVKKLFLLIICVFALLETKAEDKFVLVIDPGHGGKDIGAAARKLKLHEKDINLNVALAFGRYVEQNCPDVKVIYTRKTDRFISLDKRADIANKNKADLFISIHTNSVAKGNTARGMETFTLGMHRAVDNLEVAMRENSVILIEDNYEQKYAGFDPRSSESYIMFEFMQDKNMSQSVDLAKMVQREVCSVAKRPNRGVHQAGFLVLRCTMMPSCLIEVGFISTPSEEQLLNNRNQTDKIARGIYNAFVKYRQKYDKKGIKAKTIKIEEESEPVAEIKSSDKKSGSDIKSDCSVETGSTELIFKVQIMAGVDLPRGSKAFKGLDAERYVENGVNKYTVGCSANYNEIYRLKKTISEKFPEAFIVAFRGTKKVNIQDAIREFKSNRK